MRKIICIPTYNRPEVIEELLIRYQKTYDRLGYDIAIYDSSDNNATENIVRNYQYKYNLSYFRIDTDVHSNAKVYYIYKWFEEQDNYEYIWLQSDSIRWINDALEKITNIVDLGNYDLIIPNYRDVEGIGDREYNDINGFFEDCAWHMTLYGATIVKKTVIKNTNWKTLERKYMRADRINFSHVGLYFEQISRMPLFQAFHISLPKYSLISSLHKKEPGWRKETFFIHFKVFPNVINDLPEIYHNKEAVIKKEAINSGELTIEGIKKLRSISVLDFKSFVTYNIDFRKYSNVGIPSIFLWSVLPKWLAKRRLSQNKANMRLSKDLRSFCSKYKNIYIYGCGAKADRYATMLEDMNIQYNCFLISKGQEDKMNLSASLFHGKTVTEITDEHINAPDNGIVLALNPINTKQVLDSLKNKNIESGLYSEVL